MDFATLVDAKKIHLEPISAKMRAAEFACAACTQGSEWPHCGPPCDLPPSQHGITKAAVGKVAQRRSSHGGSPSGQFIAGCPWPPLFDQGVLVRSCRSNNAVGPSVLGVFSYCPTEQSELE